MYILYVNVYVYEILCVYVNVFVNVHCETWVRLCQAHCQENKRNVPEFPLLTARRGGLTVYATPWSQKRAAILEAFPSSGNIAAPFLGPVFVPIFGTTKE